MTKYLNNSTKNKELIKKINKAFLKGKVEFVLAHLDENIKWNIVGMPLVQGKNNFLETIEMMEAASDDCPDITVKNIIAEGEFVVVESSGNHSDKEGEADHIKSFIPSFCDIYHIKNGKIIELTTYIVDISSASDSHEV